MSKPLEEIQKELHAALAQELLDRIKSGEAKPGDLAVARQLLKDNGVFKEPEDPKDNPLGELASVLPFRS